tara:strand:- start:39 stop:467 length:429 start_codon:yes stop_codon:yes gene_type:complete
MATNQFGSGNELFMHGSTFLSGDGAILDLTGATAKYYICAITFTAAGSFEALETLDGGERLGLGDTHFASTDTATTQTLDTDWGATTHDSGNDAQLIASGNTVAAGVTIFGMYDRVELNGGDCICYVAPRPDYIERARSAKI